MNKLVDKERLDKAAKALNKIIKDSTNEEKARAIAAEELLETAIENTTQMFGGKSIRYVTQEQFDTMTEEEKNNSIITYFITDAEDLSHEHENKEFLDGLSQETLDNKVDFEDLPCYDNRVFETITSPVVFDGDLTDKTIVEVVPEVSTAGLAQDVLFYYVKISDTAPVVNGEFFSLEMTGFETFEGEIAHKTQDANVYKNDSYISFDDGIIFIYDESTITTFAGECILTPGIWLYGVQDSNSNYKYYIKNYNMTFLLEGELKKLPSQFVDYIPGKKLEGETCVVSIAQTGSDGYPEQVDNVETTAEKGSEIFNDYENNKASGSFSHSEGTETMAVDTGAHAEGVGTKALGYAAHAEGNRTSALGNGSHSEGVRSIAIGGASHSEGYETEANGERSHAEGANTKTARGTFYGHAEGYNTESNGQYASHAEGYYTKASSSYQHVQGKYNIEDAANTYAHIVGNGSSDTNRKNAHTLDWDGNAWFQGNVSIDGTPTNDNDLTTKNYVDEKLAVVDALTLNGYSLWVGTTEELEAIAEKDPNTLYFEIDNGTDEEVVQVDIVDGILQLTDDRYQKTNMVDGAEIVFPTVNKFTEIHLYFSTESNMNLNFPDNCRWRVEPNIEEGKSYEIIATYNTIEWLVNIIVYS